MRVAVIGRGGMGKLFGQKLAKDGFDVSYFGRQVETNDLVNTEVVVVATPSAAAESVNQLLEQVSAIEDKLIICLWSYMGVGSKVFAPNLTVVYVHLLFGPDIEEWIGQNIVLAGEYDHKLFEPIKQTLNKTKAHLHTCDVAQHDKLMAFTQSLSQLSSILLGISLAQSGYSRQQLQDFASLTFRLNRHTIERIMRQKAELWAELQFENEYYEPVLDQYEANLKQMITAIKSHDAEGFTELFDTAAEFWSEPQAEETIAIAESPEITADVITLGPAGTYSQAAAMQFAPEARIALANSIQEVIGSVVDGKVQQGVVPIENSIQGVVSESLDSLFMQQMVINDELVLDIHHSLCALERPQRKDHITTIYSHPQALAQCRDYLQRNYPKALLVPTASTAAGMQRIADQKDHYALAIGPGLAADLYGLTVLEQNIEDKAGNQTRFVAFAPKADLSKQLPFILIAALPKADRPGLLEDILAIMKRLDINISQIESRPDRTKLGSYMFYIRLDMASDDKRYQQIVEEAKQLKVEIRRMSA